MTEKPLSAGPVATLVAIIALFMIFYVLLLPPAERHALLNITDDVNRASSGSSIDSIEKAEIILSTSPGLVSLDVEEEREHKITPINLFVKSEAEVIDLVDSLRIRRNIFSNKFQELRFGVDDINALEGASLFFDVMKADGRLIVELNGNSVFNSVVDVGLKTINLPLGYLDRSNTLKLYVSSPGILFFTDNDYDLDDVKVSKKFKVVNAIVERRFSLNAIEKNNLDRASLDFSVYCRDVSRSEGRLEVSLNDKRVYTDVIVCDRGSVGVELDVDNFERGENILRYEIDKGDYILDPISVNTEIKGADLLKYDFFLDSDEFDDVWNGKRKAKLYLQFSEEVKKNLRFDINGESVRLSTSDLVWERDISGNVREGTNFIRIVPVTEDYDIDLLEIRLVG